MVSIYTPPVLILEAKGRDSQEDNLNSLPAVHLILFAIIYSNCDFFFLNSSIKVVISTCDSSHCLNHRNPFWNQGLFGLVMHCKVCVLFDNCLLIYAFLRLFEVLL